VRAIRVLDTGTLEQVVENARRAVADEGYTALKILLFQRDHHVRRQASRIEDLVARFAAIRETVGWDIDLGVELHRNMSAGDAVLLSGEIARLRPLFVEDRSADSVLAMRAFANKVGLPVAPESEHDDLGVRRVPRAPGVAFIRPTSGSLGNHTREKDLRPRRVLPRRHPASRGAVRPVAVAAHVQLGMCVPTGSCRSTCRRTSRAGQTSWTT